MLISSTWLEPVNKTLLRHLPQLKGNRLCRRLCFNGDRRAANLAAVQGRKKTDKQESGMAKAKKSLKKSKKLESTKPLMRSFK
jgi:hypothetical protein